MCDILRMLEYHRESLKLIFTKPRFAGGITHIEPGFRSPPLLGRLRLQGTYIFLYIFKTEITFKHVYTVCSFQYTYICGQKLFKTFSSQRSDGSGSSKIPSAPQSCIELQNLFLNFQCFQCSNPSKSLARNEKNMFYVYRIYFIGSTYPVYVLILKYS